MKRREILKGLTTVAGGTLLPASAWSIFAQQTARQVNLPLAVPIRALARKTGTHIQPVQISVRHSSSEVTAVTKFNGVEVDRRTVTEGANTRSPSIERNEHTGDMLYKTDRGHGLHHDGNRMAFPALAWRMKMRLCLGKRLEPWINVRSFYRAI
jgi:hypothetical protein